MFKTAVSLTVKKSGVISVKIRAYGISPAVNWNFPADSILPFVIKFLKRLLLEITDLQLMEILRLILFQQALRLQLW